MKKSWKIMFVLTALIIFICNLCGLILILNKSRSAKLGPSAQFYRGETVTISGNIRFKDYRQGSIIVMAKTKPGSKLYFVPDIAMVEIPRPGGYALNVPKEIGKIYIEAVNIKKRTAMGAPMAPGKTLFDIPFGSYTTNPLNVGSKDIRDINIDIAETAVPYMLTYKGPTVTLSGEVTFKGYKSGKIIVMANRDGSQQKKGADISYAELSSPGRFSLKVPKDIGKIYIETVNLKEDLEPVARDGEQAYNPFGFYSGNPLNVGSKDIRDINIDIAETAVPYMLTYKGPTVTLSGEVTFKGYKSGKIIVMANRDGSQQKKGADISYAELSSPGRFSLKVPKDIGKIYIETVNLKEDLEPVARDGEQAYNPFGFYSGNPLNVGSKDIRDIIIEITESSTPFP